MKQKQWFSINKEHSWKTKISSWGSNIIENMANFTYLEFIFIPLGEKHVGIQNLIKTGNNVWFSTNKLLLKLKVKTIKLLFKHFWFCNKSSDIILVQSVGRQPEKSRFLNDIETFHVPICKKTLGLPKHACNAIALFKLVRIPLLVLEQRQTFKYLQRLTFF